MENRIISLRGEICVHKTSLSQPLIIVVPVPSQESEGSCNWMLRVSCLPLSMIYLFHLRTDSTVRFFWFFIFITNLYLFDLMFFSCCFDHFGLYDRYRLDYIAIWFPLTYMDINYLINQIIIIYLLDIFMRYINI